MRTPTDAGKEEFGPFRNEEEYHATQKQNEVNKKLGMPLRTHYGGEYVPFPSATAKKPKE